MGTSARVFLGFSTKSHVLAHNRVFEGETMAEKLGSVLLVKYSLGLTCTTQTPILGHTKFITSYKFISTSLRFTT